MPPSLTVSVHERLPSGGFILEKQELSRIGTSVFDIIEAPAHDENEGDDKHEGTEELGNVGQCAVVVEVVDHFVCLVY